MKRTFQQPILAALLVAALVPSFTVRAAEDLTELKVKCDQAISSFKVADPSLTNLFSKATGFAILPVVGEGGFIVGAQHGDGLVYAKGKPIGTAKMTQVSVGAQAGGGSFSEVIFFENPAALTNFMQSKFEMAAAAKATLSASGAGANAKYSQGVAVFSLPRSGAMVQAAVGGQKFKFEPILERTGP